MSFPYHDQYWTETVAFLRSRVTDGQQILAPDIFWWLFPKIHRYVSPWLDQIWNYHWVVIHKGELQHLPPAFLRAVAEGMNPVFANEVFVIYSHAPNAESIHDNSDHLKAFLLALASLEPESCKPPVKPEDDQVLPDRREINRFADLDESEFKDAMNKFWKNGGYAYGTLRDKGYYKEIDRYISTLFGDGEGKLILDLCCGIGRLRKIMSQNARIVGVDVSQVAIELATEAHSEHPNFAFQLMDAHALEFTDDTFDAVLFIDAIEHVRDADQVISEAARILKTGGEFLVTVANRNSLNQIITRKLGYPEFVTNYQHIREFTFDEIREMLARHGLAITASAGVLLYPYWGIPGIDAIVRNLTDNDPEIVELMRVLGERIGPEYAYASVALARKVAPLRATT